MGYRALTLIWYSFILERRIDNNRSHSYLFPLERAVFLARRRHYPTLLIGPEPLE